MKEINKENPDIKSLMEIIENAHFENAVNGVSYFAFIFSNKNHVKVLVASTKEVLNESIKDETDFECIRFIEVITKQ